MDRTNQEEFIFGSIQLLANKLQILGDHILPELTLKQWFLLLMISKMNVKEKSINEISSFVGSTRQNIKKMLVPLEGKGYIQIHRSSKDSRALNVELTEKAFQYFEDHAELAAREVNSLFSGFSDQEIATAVTFFEKLLASVESYRSGGAVLE